MVDENKYLERVKAIRKRYGDIKKEMSDVTLRDAGKTYLSIALEANEDRKRGYELPMGIRDESQGVAYRLMESDNPRSFVLGAKLYEALGKGRKAVPKLLKAARRAGIQLHLSHLGQEISEGDFLEAKTFIERNKEKRQQGEGGIEKRVGVFVLFVIGGAALSLGSLTITGNAISNLTQTTPGLTGIILFIAGLSGMFFYFKRK